MNHRLLLAMAAIWIALPQPTAAEIGLLHTPHFRRPVAAAVCDDDRLLCVVNQRSGSVSLIDLETLDVTAEVKIGERLSDVAALPDGDTLLITDEARHELLLVRTSQAESKPTVHVTGRVPTPRSPVSVVVSEDAQLAAVAGLWSHRIAIFKPSAAAESVPLPQPSTINHQLHLTTTATIRLPFPPRTMAFVSDHPQRLIIADAFGGGIAVIDPAAGKVVSVRELPAHNIRGLALSPDGDRLLVTHQILNPLARTDFDDIHWGSLMQNVVRTLSVQTLLDPQTDLLDDSRRIRLGQTGNAAADPAGIAVLTGIEEDRPDGIPFLVALSGTNEVAVERNSVRHRHEVGVRPVDVLWDERRQQAYVVSSLDDSVTALKRKRGHSAFSAETPCVNGNRPPKKQNVPFFPTTVSLGPTPDPSPRDRGERLFYDGTRSHDGWLSCHSCHTDGHTNGGLADTLSDGSYGTAKHIPSLLGVRDANPWAWNGQFRDLHAQVNASFTSTMNGDPLSPPEVNDVVAFLHTLLPPPPVNEGQMTEQEQQQIGKGKLLFNSLGCRKCHVPPVTYSIDLIFDVGLEDENGLSKFNPPSLRGISQRRRFLHDGRAESLESVFTDHGHQLNRELSADKLNALVAFLTSL